MTCTLGGLFHMVPWRPKPMETPLPDNTAVSTGEGQRTENTAESSQCLDVPRIWKVTLALLLTIHWPELVPWPPRGWLENEGGLGQQLVSATVSSLGLEQLCLISGFFHLSTTCSLSQSSKPLLSPNSAIRTVPENNGRQAPKEIKNRPPSCWDSLGR